jgi:3-hydroxybutyryl-CoA dehydrogenase
MTGSVAIIGAGAMGTGVARLCLESGRSVRLADRSPDALARGVELVRSRHPAVADRMVGMEIDEALVDCSVVIDATPQVAAEKQTIVRRALDLAPSDALIGTITLGLPLERIDPDHDAQARLVGLHFMNPPHRLRFCELVTRRDVSAVNARAAADFLDSLGVRHVRVQDVAGFILNRMLIPFLFDAVRAVGGGLGEARDVDLAFTAGCGHPMGPLSILDLIGLDVAVALGDAMVIETGDVARFEPPALLRRMADAGDRFDVAPTT